MFRAVQNGTPANAFTSKRVVRETLPGNANSYLEKTYYDGQANPPPAKVVRRLSPLSSPTNSPTATHDTPVVPPQFPSNVF